MWIYIIATDTRSAISPGVFSNQPLANLSEGLNFIGCYSATCHLKRQKCTVSFSLKANVTVKVKI